MPKQYQASAQIQMAQFSLKGPNVEEPALLISRLSSPTSFTAEVKEVCGLGFGKDAQAILSKAVKLTLPRGATNLVDMKIISTSPEVTVICAQAVFDLIKSTQFQIVKPYIEEAEARLLDDQERLERLKDFLAKADKRGSAMGNVYLSTRDEIRFLLDGIAATQYLKHVGRQRISNSH
jgi:hypothetical protein